MRRVAEDPGRLDLVGAPEGFDALVMADVVKARKGLSVFIARDGSRMSAFADAFRFFAPNVEVVTFPAWDCLPYDRIGPSAGVAAQRAVLGARQRQARFQLNNRGGQGGRPGGQERIRGRARIHQHRALTG